MTEQLQLAAGGEWDEQALVQSERARGVFSGELLRKSDPEKFDLIVGLLAKDKMSIAEIARAVQSSRNLISAIRRNQAVEIEQLRAKLGRGAAHIAELCQEAQEEILTDPARRAKLQLRDLAVAQGVAIDKMQVLTGGATSRLEVVAGAGPDHDAFMAEMGLAGSCRGQKVIEAEAVEVGPARLEAGEDPGSGERGDDGDKEAK